MRKLKEELGIIAQNFEYWKSEEHTCAEYTVVLHFFHVTGFLNMPLLIEGHDALAWVSPAGWDELEFLPADAQILCELKEKYPAGPAAGC